MAKKRSRDFSNPFVSISPSQALRRFSLVLYCDEFTLLDILNRRQDYISNYAYIIHDSDQREVIQDGKVVLSPDGVPLLEFKEKHIHLLLFLNRQVTASSVSRWFFSFDDSGRKQTVLLTGIGDAFGCYGYLTHRYHPDKFQYPPSAVRTSSSEFFDRLDCELNDSLSSAWMDFYFGADPYTLVKRYGRDFIIHWSSIKSSVEFQRSLPYERARFRDDPLRELYEIN